MPKKVTQNRVEKAANSSVQAVKDVGIVREAARNNELTEDERLLYSFFSPAFVFSEEVQKSTRKPKKETAIPSESFEPVEDGNDSQFAAPTTN